MNTRALCTFGVWNRRNDPLSDERGVLAFADGFRAAICGQYQERHDSLVRLRDELFPALFAAMVESESIRW